MTNVLTVGAVRSGRGQVLSIAISNPIFPTIVVVMDRNVFGLGAAL